LSVLLALVEVLRVPNNIVHLVEDFVDLVDVVDIAKYDLTVSVIPHVLEATALEPIALRAEFGPGVEDHDFRIVDERVLVVGRLSDFHEHVFVVRGSPGVPEGALRAPPNGVIGLLMIIGHRGKPVFRSEFRAAFKLTVRNISGYRQHFRVSLAEVKTFIRIQSELPVFVPQINSLPPHFTPNICIEGPAINVISPIRLLDFDFVEVWERHLRHIIWRDGCVHVQEGPLLNETVRLAA
jgi:hypothetical protein